MKTFTPSLESLWRTTIRYQQWRSVWLGETHLIMCKAPVSIQPLWYVDVNNLVYIAYFELGIQLRGLASAINYLHTHPSGPIFHGDIRGVSFYSILCIVGSWNRLAPSF